MTTEFFRIQERNNGQATIDLLGDWTVQNYARLARELRQFRDQSVHISLEQLNNLDTAGTLQIVDNFGVQALRDSLDAEQAMAQERRQMILTVLKALPDDESITVKPEPWTLSGYLAQVGQATIRLKDETIHWLGFFGLALQTFFSLMFQPAKWRITSVVANIDNSGYKAAPIVMLLCFMVGAVVAFLGATVLQSFGAEVFVVHLVAYSFLREFATLLTAILMAGRTASAFTAQIGSMKVNEELSVCTIPCGC